MSSINPGLLFLGQSNLKEIFPNEVHVVMAVNQEMILLLITNQQCQQDPYDIPFLLVGPSESLFHGL